MVAAGVDQRRVIMRIIDRLNVGGPAIHAVLTSKGVDPSRFRTILVYGSVEHGEADMSDLADQADIERVIIPALGRELRPLRDLRTAWHLFRLMRRERPDIVHTHKAKAGAIGRFAALLAGVPIRVHTFHGHVFHGYFSPPKTRAFLAIERLLGRFTSRIVALSDGLVDELSEKYRIAPRDRFSVIPLGFDLEPLVNCARHRGALREELGIAEGRRLVGIVGRMVPVKDHKTFVATIEILARTHADVDFVFVGGGELEQEVRRDIESRGLLSRCHLLGWRRDLDRIYADLDLVALSSVNEGTPVTVIEAMAAGVPVAATAVGGVPDVLGHGAHGELAKPSDPADLARAIERGLSPEARDRAQRTRPEIIRRYGNERLCSDLAHLYAELDRP